MKRVFDFSGWATKNDLECADGRVIRRDAFKANDGKTVPLVWSHQHNEIRHVLGHADLENRPDGVYAYCTFNDTEYGKMGKTLVQHGDIKELSIWANRLKQSGADVVHGIIRELSLVMAGANPGAYIDTILEHGEDGDEEAFIYTNEQIELFHADEEPLPKDPKPVSELEHVDKPSDEPAEVVPDWVKTFNTMNPEQQTLVYALMGKELEDQEDIINEESDTTVKHNVFEGEKEKGNFLSHSDQAKILTTAKSSSVGSFKAALEMFVESNDAIAHAAGDNDNGIANISTLFPEYRDVRPGAPEMLTTDQGWIGVVLNKVHKSPISRIRTRQADVRDITALRAKGYVKGTEKGYVGNIKLVSRTTDPQTVYVKSKLDRDDIVDIVDFDVVAYMYNIDRMNLNEELAMAIMLGDGRDEGDEGKIHTDHIRPVWTDDELFTIHKDVDMDAMRAELQGTDTGTYFGDNYVYAEAIIQALLYAREKYKGSGVPDFYCTPHLLNVMLLARDRNGRRIYDNTNDLKASLNVGSVITAEQFEGKTRVTSDTVPKTKKLLGIMYNLADYSVGNTKGGEISHFTQFDIDFNQEKSLIETRLSGANTRVLSAIALEEDVTI